MRYAIFAGCLLLFGYFFITPHTSVSGGVADATTTTAVDRATYSRAAFTDAVSRRTGEEIIARFGKPDSTQSIENGAIEYWYYRGLTVDSTTGKIDHDVQIRLERSMDQIRQVSVIREASVSFN